MHLNIGKRIQLPRTISKWKWFQIWNENGNKSLITNGYKKIQFENENPIWNENKRPFDNWTEKSIKSKIEKWWIKKKDDPIRKCKWKFN